ncbi:MAG: hypothetical protein Q7T19_13245 [Caulobacter sp.]|nr:hypothetical protein [Caulobacter sp.]
MVIAAMFAVALAGSETQAAIEASMATLQGEPISTLVGSIGQPNAERIIDGRRAYDWVGGGCQLRVAVDTRDRIEAWEVHGGRRCRGLGVSLRLLVEGRKA